LAEREKERRTDGKSKTLLTGTGLLMEGPIRRKLRSSGRKISWALCRIPVRPFDYIVKAGHPKTVTAEMTNWHVNARTVRESNIEASTQSRLYFPGAPFGGMAGIDVFREIRK
jgi:hypothetical protein